LLPVILLPFIVAGLSLLHAMMANKKGANALLAGTYCLLFLLFPYVAGLLALLGFADSCYDFRRRIVRSTISEL
jgi:uncharacterized protein YybS (DUF2232 family)